jgi:hypothetical protein
MFGRRWAWHAGRNGCCGRHHSGLSLGLHNSGSNPTADEGCDGDAIIEPAVQCEQGGCDSPQQRSASVTSVSIASAAWSKMFSRARNDCAASPPGAPEIGLHFRQPCLSGIAFGSKSIASAPGDGVAI